MEDYRLEMNFGMAPVIADVKQSIAEDDEFVNESMADVLKAATLATLLSVPGIVDAKEITKMVGGAGATNKVVQVSSPDIQKKIYDAIGKDRYNDAVIVNIIARTLMGEAVGDKSNASFDAVASVIWNRSGGDKSRFISTIFKPKQFSCWNGMTNDDKRKFVIKPHGRALTNPSAWKYCVDTAKKMVDGNFEPTGKWKYFYAHGRVTPEWADKLTNKKVIGNHTFGTI